jgi:hypothetical protein
MKLVDRHEEGQGNPREEVAVDSQRAYVNVWSSQLRPPLHSRIFLSKVVTALPDLLERNGYPKSGMNFITKPLENLRTSSLRRPCSSSRNLTNLLRCIRGRVILHWRSVDASWMAIVYESMKLKGCQRRQPTHEK